MSISTPRNIPTEITALEKFFETLSLSPEQIVESTVLVEKLTERFSRQEKTLGEVISSVDDLSFLVKTLQFDLDATKQERDTKRQESERD